jgi:acetate kinase
MGLMISTAAPAEAVLAVNIGSSSVKFAAYPAVGRQLHAPLFSGSIQGLQAGGRLKAHWKNAGRKEQRELEASPADLNALGTLTTALAFLKTLLAQEMGSTQLLAVAHRVVHGGAFYSSAVVVTQEVLANLKTMASLAPLHQPHNIHGIEVFTTLFPEVPQVACFDTAFHKDLPDIEKRYALPDKLYQEGIHRYGFHGLSYRYVSSRLTQHSVAASGRLVMAHLGNGSSVCGCIAGKSMATSMGFSAAGGLMMGTRSGDIDPGVLLYLLDQGWTPHDLQQLVYFESGLKGVSQISADMRELKASTDPRAQFAIALYEYHVVRQIGGLIASLGGIDALAFTGGIGEHDVTLRSNVCRGLGFAGILLNEQANAQVSGTEITPLHLPESRVEVWLVPTDEGRIAAEETISLLDL